MLYSIGGSSNFTTPLLIAVKPHPICKRYVPSLFLVRLNFNGVLLNPDIGDSFLMDNREEELDDFIVKSMDICCLS